MGYKNLDHTFAPAFQDESQLPTFRVANCDAIGENSRTESIQVHTFCTFKYHICMPFWYMVISLLPIQVHKSWVILKLIMIQHILKWQTVCIKYPWDCKEHWRLLSLWQLTLRWHWDNSCRWSYTLIRLGFTLFNPLLMELLIQGVPKVTPSLWCLYLMQFSDLQI